MEEQEFETLAQATLARLADALEDAGDDIEAELEGGVLTISVVDAGTFLLNKHAPLRQLWYSSPLSGASHYGYQGGTWVSTRDGSKLTAVLMRDLKQAAGIELSLG